MTLRTRPEEMGSLLLMDITSLVIELLQTDEIII